MTKFTKIDAIKAHLRIGSPAAVAHVVPQAAAADAGKRVQKNLSILEHDAERLASLAKRDGVSQARLLSAALDAYETAPPTK